MIMNKIQRVGYIVFLVSFLFAGGIVHNTNHSADFIRTLNRNASTDVDAAYFNPAGLVKLNDGFHLYLSNQTVWQTRTVETEFPKYNENTFTGETFVPSFPNIYFVKKSGKMAFSGGFMPIGGGGSADFPNGLPSFDYELAKLVGFSASVLIDKGLDPDLADSVGTFTGYSVESGFVGSSVYFAGQGNVSMAFGNMLSIAVGIRYLYALNTYEGSLENSILIAENGNIEGFIPDITVDSKRTGSAFTPIISLYLSPSSLFGLSFRFEPTTKLEVLAETKEDGTIVLGEPGMFPDGESYREDIPGQLACGLNLMLKDNILIATSFNYYLNSQVNWDGDEEFVENGFEVGAGIDYGLNDNLAVSAGFLRAVGGANDQYQTDLSYSLTSSTVAGGFKYRFNPKAVISVGVSNTLYDQGQNDDVGTDFEERYDKTALDIALGLQYSF